jgi:hypothetical protein
LRLLAADGHLCRNGSVPNALATSAAERGQERAHDE